MSDECVYMGGVACLTHHSVRRLEEDQDSCDWLRAEKAEAAIERVRELHGRLEVAGLSGPSFVCLECYDAEWPCATIRALDGDA